ncbi:Rhodanese-like protein [Acephala macrosclerotiorum]|nr:Rhodanese-like protein [Acephala macrosclerotiorum]
MRRMSTHTIATLPRLSSTDLSQILLSNTSSNVDAQTPPSKIAIVDVRDDDHIGGHIKHSIHAPSNTLDYKIPELVRKLKDKETVVFHCALSQQRGPSAALRYIRERDRLLNLGAHIEKQKVYVLDRGFVGWQERFGEDTRLTEGYRKEVWKNGY